MLGALRRRAAHNGLELSCPAARATPHSFSRILAGKSRSNFPHASRVSCSELLCVRERQAGGRSATAPHHQTPAAAPHARRRLTPRARLHYLPRLASEHDGPPSKGLPQSLSGKTPSPRPSPARQITIDCNGSLEIRPLTGASRVSMVCGGERRITAGS